MAGITVSIAGLMPQVAIQRAEIKAGHVRQPGVYARLRINEDRQRDAGRVERVDRSCPVNAEQSGGVSAAFRLIRSHGQTLKIDAGHAVRDGSHHGRTVQSAGIRPHCLQIESEVLATKLKPDRCTRQGAAGNENVRRPLLQCRHLRCPPDEEGVVRDQLRNVLFAKAPCKLDPDHRSHTVLNCGPLHRTARHQRVVDEYGRDVGLRIRVGEPDVHLPKIHGPAGDRHVPSPDGWQGFQGCVDIRRGRVKRDVCGRCTIERQRKGAACRRNTRRCQPLCFVRPVQSLIDVKVVDVPIDAG